MLVCVERTKSRKLFAFDCCGQMAYVLKDTDVLQRNNIQRLLCRGHVVQMVENVSPKRTFDASICGIRLFTLEEPNRGCPVSLISETNWPFARENFLENL